MNEQKFYAGTFIFRAGDPGERAYLIREGKVDLLRGDAERPERIGHLGPGDVFGETSLVEERPNQLTAWAVTAVKATTLTREEFEKLLATEPATVNVFLKAVFERVRTATGEGDAAATAATTAAQPAASIVSVTIHPLSRRAAETLPDEGLLIPKFPFRMGRASEHIEREPLDLNDLWLLDREPFNVSRNHVSIELQGNTVLVKDRGSSMGTYVNDDFLGGEAKVRQAALVDGDNVLILGGRTSPYQFRVHVTRG
jgi:CRP-like cAMP-binding protein